MRTFPSRLLVATSTILILGASLAACGGAASTIDEGTGDIAGGATGRGSTGGAAPLPAATAAPGAVDGSGETPQSAPGATVDDARIVRTGTIDLEVKDVTTALHAARDGIRALGGYIGASQTSNQDDRPYASITYRVPVTRWEEALDLLRSLGGQTTKVVTEQTQAVEVTGSIVDLQARIRNLRASEAALQEIAARAVKISDVLEVQAQLTEVRGQIESLTAQLKDIEDRADFATLAATFSTPVIAVQVASKDWDPRAVVDEAMASLLDVMQALTTAGIWFAIVWLPMLAGLAVVVILATWLVRRLGGRWPRSGRGGGQAGHELPVA